MRIRIIATIMCVLFFAVDAESQEKKETIRTVSTQCVGLKDDTLVVVSTDMMVAGGSKHQIDNVDYYPCYTFVRYIHGDTTKVFSTNYYRQEGDKVYCHDGKEGSEAILLMDFGLNVGDDFLTASGERLRVVAIKDTLEGTARTRLFELECSEDPLLNDRWLEGCGSLKTGLLPPSIVQELDRSSFLWNTGVSSTPFGTVNTDYVKTDLPLDEETKDDVSSEPWQCWFESDTLRVSGYMYRNVRVSDLYVAYIDGNDIYIDITPGAARVWGMAWKKVDLKFGGFKSGTYRVHFNNFVWASISGYDVFVKCYLDTIVQCDGNPASVPNLKADQPTTAARGIYDLTGRRLTSEPARGIFIRDGKKVRK